MQRRIAPGAAGFGDCEGDRAAFNSAPTLMHRPDQRFRMQLADLQSRAPDLIKQRGINFARFKRVLRGAGITALHATAVVVAGSALIYLPVYAVFLPKQIPTAPFRDILLQAMFQGVLVSIVALYAFNRSAELLGPVTGATLPALIPPVILILGLLVLREPAGMVEIATAIMIGLGVALILAVRRQGSATAPKPAG